MKYLSLLIIGTFSQFPGLSQSLIEVKAQPDSKGDYQFICMNHGYSNFILEVSLSDMQNLKTDFKVPYTTTIRPGSNTLFTLKKDNPSQASNFRYTYRFAKGCLNSKVDMDYSYLFPVAPGKETVSSEMVYFLKKFADEPEPKDWYAIALKMDAGDTVFCSRRGTVCEVKDNAQLQQSGYEMSSVDNYVEISHDDCSFGRYQVFRDRQIFVKPGQFVEAGDPLGIVGGDKYVSGPHIRFCVYYHLGKDALKTSDRTHASQFAYIPVQFWTKDMGKIKLTNNAKYISDHPADLITKEMNKRELKKWTERHRN